MNTTLNNLIAGLRNSHISIPLVAAIALEIIPVFWPDKQAACQKVQKILLTYGVIVAANSGPTPTNKP